MSKPFFVLLFSFAFVLNSEASSLSMEKNIQNLCLDLKTKFCKIQNTDRRVLLGNIVDYSFSLKVGSAPEDVIKVHRVVKEKSNGRPVKTKSGVFLVHGDAFGFDQIFLAGLTAQEGIDSHSYAIFLAQKNIDVWGMDRRWVAVQPGVTNFNFMKNWNVNTEVQDISVALTAARLLRLQTGSGFDKLILNGWSSGAFLTYAYANYEAKRPQILRHVKAMIPIDIAFKFSPAAETERLKSCGRLTAMEAAYASGVYNIDAGTIPALLGSLADNTPSSPSPVLAGFTNYQAAMFLGGFIYLADPSFDIVPVFHQTAAQVDGTGMPQGLLYTEEEFFIDFLQQARPFMNLGTRIDMETALCNQTNSPHDDHLDDIKIPTLYVGAAGGFGEFGFHTQSLLGSSDVTNLVIQKLPLEQRLFDYGHSDLFLAEDAETEVWGPVSQWIESH